MGCFNSVWVRCPQCGESVEFQTKAGDCSLKSIGERSISLSEAEDLNRDSTTCGQCDTGIVLEIEQVVRPQFKFHVRKYDDLGGDYDY